MKYLGLIAILGFVVAGCGAQSPFTQQGADQSLGETENIVRPQTRPNASSRTQPPPGARTAEQFDTSTRAERAAALSGNGGAERALGKTIASLGTPSETGFWLKTPLVTEEGPGRVVYAATGKSVAVRLIPIDGPVTAGSRMSLGALRLIDAPLTGLPEVQVFALRDG